MRAHSAILHSALVIRRHAVAVVIGGGQRENDEFPGARHSEQENKFDSPIKMWV
jgi:hypothetical protein